MLSSAPPAPPPWLMWRVLLGATTARTRALIAAGAVLGVAGRLGLVGAAITIGQGHAGRAGLVGSVAGVLFVVQRVALTAARLGAECDLYRAEARALVDTDVLEVPMDDLQRVVFETNHHGRMLVGSTMPALAADLVAALTIAPLLVALLPGRVLTVAFLGLVVVLTSLLAVRGFVRRLQDGLREASRRLGNAVLMAVDGRLELVARGGEEAFKRAFDETLDTYARVASRSSLGSALLGRFPLLLGAGVVAAAALFDSASRAALGSTVLSQALFFAACMPVLLGVVLGTMEVARAGPLLAPLVTLLGVPPRPELSFAGAKPQPTAFALENVTFRYSAGAPSALTDIDAVWPPGSPLMVVGANGGGKSTLLRLLLGLRAPTAGVVRAGTSDLAELDVRALRRQIAYLPQRPYLGEAYSTVREAMHFGCPDASEEAISASLGRAGLLESLKARKGDPFAIRIGELSAGQRQRVALARILVQDAQIVLLDEPDANLDRAGVALVAALVVELVAAGKMVAVAAHTPELAAIPSVKIEVEREGL